MYLFAVRPLFMIPLFRRDKLAIYIEQPDGHRACFRRFTIYAEDFIKWIGSYFPFVFVRNGIIRGCAQYCYKDRMRIYTTCIEYSKCYLILAGRGILYGRI